MPKKGSSGDYNWSFSFSPRKGRPRPKLFQEDRRSLQNILVDSVKNYKFRNNEIFKRMKVTTFVQMVLHIAEFEYHGDPATHNDTDTPFRPDTADLEVQKIQAESGGGGGNSASGVVSSSAKLDTREQGARREELLQRVGMAESSTCSARPRVNTHTCPYLLLDLRDREAFEECHIITAKSYPNPTLARAVNFESKDMLRFRNQEGKVVVLYDNDETTAVKAATTLVERGYENLFLLTGGLKLAYKLFPNGLITGTVPDYLCPEYAEGAKVSTSRVKVASRAARSHTKLPAMPNRSDFTQDDLDCLHIFIDNALMDNSSGSRLTQRPKRPPGRTSTLSTLSSSTETAGMGRPPFKL